MRIVRAVAIRFTIRFYEFAKQQAILFECHPVLPHDEIGSGFVLSHQDSHCGNPASFLPPSVMSRFLSFSPASTLAQALATVRQAQLAVERFTKQGETQTQTEEQERKKDEKSETGTEDDSDQEADDTKNVDASVNESMTASSTSSASGTAAVTASASGSSAQRPIGASATDPQSNETSSSTEVISHSRKRKAAEIDDSDDDSSESDNSDATAAASNEQTNQTQPQRQPPQQPATERQQPPTEPDIHPTAVPINLSDDDMDVDDTSKPAMSNGATSSAASPSPLPSPSPSPSSLSGSCQTYTSLGPLPLRHFPPAPSGESFDSIRARGGLAREYEFELDTFQKRCVEIVEQGHHLLVAAHTSAGKCWAPGTRLLLHSGEGIVVEDIKEGDALMGDDCTPRIVQPGSIRHGWGAMYEVRSHDETRPTWRCNADHILVLRASARPWYVADGGRHGLKRWELRRGSSAGSHILCESAWLPIPMESEADARNWLESHETCRCINSDDDCCCCSLLDFEVSVSDYLYEMTPQARAAASMFQPSSIHYPPPPPPSGGLRERLQRMRRRKMRREAMCEEELERCAWMMGVWSIATSATTSASTAPLSCASAPCITLPPTESAHQLASHFTEWRRRIFDEDADKHDSIKQEQQNGCGTIHCPPTLSALLASNSLQFPCMPPPSPSDSYLPLELRTGSLDVRRAFLAGCIDASSVFQQCPVNSSTHSILCPTQPSLRNDLIHLVRSVGCRISVGGTLHGACIHLHGSACHSLPTLLLTADSSKFSVSCHTNEEEQCRHHPHWGRFDIVQVEDGPYIGFTVDGNSRFLMEGFIVTHNTVVAEYAIAQVFRENARRKAQCDASGVPFTPDRVIYTAPIKALSNQKYREFKEVFHDGSDESVGLLTGDVILNPSAVCLIMTTEILRAMLYEGSLTLHSTTKVIYDEVHYMRDVERGIIWEESIIMLRPEVQCIFLSATLANAKEFAEWIHEIKCTTEMEGMDRARAQEERMTSRIDNGGSITSAPSSPPPAPVATRSSSIWSRVSLSAFHRATCHVVWTDMRPVPLVHYIMLKGGSGIYMIKNDAAQQSSMSDADSNENEKEKENEKQHPLPSASTVGTRPKLILPNLRKAKLEIEQQQQQSMEEQSKFAALLKNNTTASTTSSGTRSAPSTPSASSSSSYSTRQQQIEAHLRASRARKRSQVPDLIRVLSLASQRDWLPMIVFSFSRRECEAMSLIVSENRYRMDLTTVEEKEIIETVWERALDSLSDEDRSLPQLKYMHPLIVRGLALHHSGLLPLVKEVVEILLQEGLIKVLFATETFAMGINVPVRCVLFSQLEKFDGRSVRRIHAAEYTQMAGRAGRRGIDTKGIVIMMVEKTDVEKEIEANDRVEKSMSTQVGSAPSLPLGPISSMLTSACEPLHSKFRLTYNMILNLIRCSSTFDPAYILAKSLLHFQETNPLSTLHRTRAKKAGAGVGATSNGTAAAAARPSTSASLTTVGSRRSRMGEIGIQSIAAAGSKLLEQQQQQALYMSDPNGNGLEEAREQMTSLESAIAELNISAAQQQQILTYQAQYSELCRLHHEVYEYSQRHPWRAILPFLQSGRLVFIEQPAVAPTNASATAESSPGSPAVTWGWGIVVHWRKRHAAGVGGGVASRSEDHHTAAAAPSHPAEYVVDVLLPLGQDADGSERVNRWGEAIIPLPRTGRAATGAQVWEHGKMDLERRVEDEMKDSSTSNAHSSSPPYHIVNCSLSMIHSISSVRLYLPASLELTSSVSGSDVAVAMQLRHALFLVLEQCCNNFPRASLPKIRPQDFAPDTDAGAATHEINDKEEGEIDEGMDETHVLDEEGSTATSAAILARREEARLSQVASQLTILESALTSSPVHDLPLSTVQRFLSLHGRRAPLLARLSTVSCALSSTHLVSYRVELKTRLRILRRFKHLTAEGLITNKGRIAADLNAADELLLTEFIYEGHWLQLSAAELVSILAALLDVERSSASRLPLPTTNLEEAFNNLRRLGTQLCAVCNECGLIIDTQRYLAAIKSDLIPLVYAWTSRPAIKFRELVSMSDLFEGTLTRLFRRLDEMIQQLLKSAQTIGERNLHDRLAEGQKLLKKGIIFAGSLYI